MCEHQPPCPSVDLPEWDTARVIATHDELGWLLLCNGAVVLHDQVRQAPIDLAVLRRGRRSLPARAERAAA